MEDYSSNQETRLDLSPVQEAIEQIRENISKVIVGQQDMVDQVITALLSDGHILLEGVPGVAKTLTAKLIAKTLSVNFSRIQFTPDLMPSDILGTSVFNARSTEFEFKPGPIFNNLILVDEINRAPAKTQSALFEVMQEQQVTIEGTTYPVKKPFLVIATQNPIEQEGTYRLPEAQLDRFMLKINVGYLPLEEETRMLQEYHERANNVPVNEIPSVITAEKLQEYQQLVRQIHIEQELVQYIANIVHKTRNYPDLYLGASPRASLSILTTSKAWAAIQGRDFVTPEDIKKMSIPVLQHRVMLTPEKEMEGQSTGDVIQQLIEEVEIPKT